MSDRAKTQNEQLNQLLSLNIEPELHRLTDLAHAYYEMGQDDKASDLEQFVKTIRGETDTNKRSS